MTPEHAAKLVREMRTYRDRATKRPHSRGSYIRQTLIPYATRADISRAIGTVGKTAQDMKTVWIWFDDMISEQRCLMRRRLVYQLRRKPKKRPYVVRVAAGRYLIWDGNHRVTAAMIKGLPGMKCALIFRKR